MKKKLKLAMMMALKECGDFLLPQTTLFTSAQLAVRPEPMFSELKEALRELEVAGLIVGGRTTLDDAPGWKLTANGKATLAEEGC